MAVTQYVGARYVPLFADPIDWTSDREYEPLTIVLHEGNSYTTKQYTPKGIDISDTRYWALSANYNAQMDAYRNEVKQFDGRIDANATAISAETTRATAAESKNADAIAANTTAISSNTAMLNATAQSPLKTLVDANTRNINTILPMDITPTKDSTKGVTSGGMYKMLDTITTGTAPLNIECAFSTSLNTYYELIKIDRSRITNVSAILTGNTTPYDYARTNDNCLIINMGLGSVLKSEGTILADYSTSTDYGSHLNFTSDFTPSYVIDAAHSLTASDLKSYYTSFTAYEPLLDNGVIIDASQFSSQGWYNYIIYYNHIRQVFGWDDDYLYVLTIEGRSPSSLGTTHNGTLQLLTELGIKNAINGDGGGSVITFLTNPPFNLTFNDDNSFSSGYHTRNVTSLMKISFE